VLSRKYVEYIKKNKRQTQIRFRQKALGEKKRTKRRREPKRRDNLQSLAITNLR